LFVTLHDSYCQSDSGSLIPLISGDIFIAKYYTQNFASKEHIERIENKKSATLDELLLEDFN